MPIYAFGSNGAGQLGLNHLDDVSRPSRVYFDADSGDGRELNLSIRASSPGLRYGDGDGTAGLDLLHSDHRDPVRHVAAGGNHTLLLFWSGAVYAAGLNDAGRRCGGEGDECVRRFQRMRVKGRNGRVVELFKDVAATWAATFLVSSSSLSLEEGGGDEVFVLGAGLKGELGLGIDKTCISDEEGVGIIPDFPPPGLRIKAIASGMSHTVVVLSNGDVYGWGAARKGQLGGKAIVQKIVWSPARIDGIGGLASEVACGREFTVVTAQDGGYRVLGVEDKWGVISGASDAAAGLDWRVWTSWHGVYVHAPDQAIISWGRNDRGQLPPLSLEKEKVALIAVGSEHVLALLQDRKTVVAFGWGEHGNCGPDVDDQGNVKGRYNVIPLELTGGEKVVGLGAGCATSWIITSR
ncbi:regulator of chromosome condensation 1/beta-lactamase-inhibitor protein II [Talaromyces proteolyticus]|uniref:Regulator of chromosome condensation 1/beta-lactamase-inhibitor protein II n=1 Tax=Talaromyces proteolyticus TaxID=1131652 RepID=A0AAD4KHF7_9EURO|nr:regulator of chromosome condensation 1/beta-lactamase-inhibitor protein II [Talaromyces proteolyticus]KAH8691292.1 regulator of chromosome condensation 1/beta-lactamase-inhibitor protein II [Talaromyces proteolyticus]